MEVYGDECLSRIQDFEWFKRFKEGRGEIEEQVKFQSNDDRFFSITEGLFTFIMRFMWFIASIVLNINKVHENLRVICRSPCTN
jgi:hypothetical protein